MSIVLVGPGTKRAEGWLWRRYLIEGTRLEPYWVASRVLAGDTVESVADDFDLSVDAVQEAVDWTQKRRAAARRGWIGRRA